MNDLLSKTWAIHNYLNLYFLDVISDRALGLALPKRRTVFEQFAHQYNVRLMWLKVAAPELMEGLKKLKIMEGGAKDQLHTVLERSGGVIDSLLQKGIVSGGKVKGFKPRATAFLDCLIGHKPYHRGQTSWPLKQSSQLFDQKTAHSLQEWTVRQGANPARRDRKSVDQDSKRR